MSNRVLLTEQREKLIAGDYDGSDEATRAQHWRLNQSIKTVLDELTTIANSEEVENVDAFDAGDVRSLLTALTGEPSSITPFWEVFGDETARRSYVEEHGYQQTLASMFQSLSVAYNPLIQIDEPPEFVSREDVELFETVDE